MAKSISLPWSVVGTPTVHRHPFISAKTFVAAISSRGVLKSPAIIQTPFQFLTKLISSARMDELGLVLIEVPVFR